MQWDIIERRGKFQKINVLVMIDVMRTCVTRTRFADRAFRCSAESAPAVWTLELSEHRYFVL